MYDDEGYMLLSLDHYLRGGRLYTDVFSQYGPFYFFAHTAAFRLLQAPVTHDGGRLVTITFWMVSSGLAGFFLYRISRNVVLAAAAALACAALLHDLSFEPGHPQLEILLILVLSCCAATFSGAGSLLLLGACGAALLFTKINVGVFYLAALAHVMICGLPKGRIRSGCVAMMLAYALAFPFILMRPQLPQTAGLFEVAALSGTMTFLVAASLSPQAKHPIRALTYSAGGVLLGAVLICAEAMREGVSWHALLEGVVWAPLRHPGVYSVILPVAGINWILAAIVAWALYGLHRFRARWQDRSDWLAALQCVVGLVAIPLLAYSAANITWFLPFLPLALLRAKELPWTEWMPRAFVACLSAAQFLQIYPVAGTQVAIAATPLMIWAFVCVHDGAGGLARVFGRVAPGNSRDSVLGGVLVLGFAAAMIGSGACSQAYATPASGLRGASWLHLPADREAGYRFLADGIRANCDVLFTLPGMGSFNFWSGVPTPNGQNATAWVKSFSPQIQQEILDILRAHPRACAVYSDEMAYGWKNSTRELESSPLAHYIKDEMPKVAERMGYEIRVHPQRATLVDASVIPGARN